MLSLILVAALFAQDKPAEKKPEPPKLADVLRENETLRRQVEQLQRDMRIRDTFITLATAEKERVLTEISTDRGLASAQQKRCATIEAHLREIEDPKKDATFDCATLTFAEKPK